MKEPIRKLVADFPASVMDQLVRRKAEGKGSIKDQILEALKQAYGIEPKNEEDSP